MLLPDLQRITHIQKYCENIMDCIDRFGSSFETFQNDLAFQHAISFCVLQIGELVVGLTQEYRDGTKDRIQWKQIRGMRNIVAHAYDRIKLDLLWNTVIADIPELKQFCDEQLASEDQTNEP